MIIRHVKFMATTKRRPTGPMDALFRGAKVAKVIDFLNLQEEHQTKTDICKGARISRRNIDEIVTTLLNMEILGVGAQVVDEKKGTTENTYYIRKDTAGGKAIEALYDHLRRSEMAHISV
jgi:hypothetical protein